MCKQQLVRDKAHGQIFPGDTEINFGCELFSFQFHIQQQREGDQSVGGGVGPSNVFCTSNIYKSRANTCSRVKCFIFVCSFLGGKCVIHLVSLNARHSSENSNSGS